MEEFERVGQADSFNWLRIHVRGATGTLLSSACVRESSGGNREHAANNHYQTSRITGLHTPHYISRHYF